MLSNQSTRRIALAPSPKRRGSLLIRDWESKVGKLQSYRADSLDGESRGSALRVAGSADILASWSCQIRAWPHKAGNGRRLSSHSGVFVCAAAGSPARSHPAPPPTPVSAPSAPPSASAGQRAGGRRRGWRQTLSSGLQGPEAPALRGRQRPQVTVSAATEVSGPDPAGSRPPGYTAASPLRCSPAAATPEGEPAVPEPRAAPRSTGPEAQSPPLRPAPTAGLGPEGGSGEGRRGPHPQPLPCPRPGPPGAAPAPRLPLRPGTRDPPRQPLGRAPPSGTAPPDPKFAARRQPRQAAARARRRARRMRSRRRFSVLDVWRRWPEEGERESKAYKCQEMFIKQEKHNK